MISTFFFVAFVILGGVLFYSIKELWKCKDSYYKGDTRRGTRSKQEKKDDIIRRVHYALYEGRWNG